LTWQLLKCLSLGDLSLFNPQLKILTTAGFAVALLNRQISSAKWRALILLVVGCVLVASPAYNQPVECVEGTETVESITLVDGSKAAEAEISAMMSFKPMA